MHAHNVHSTQLLISIHHTDHKHTCTHSLLTAQTIHPHYTHHRCTHHTQQTTCISCTHRMYSPQTTHIPLHTGHMPYTHFTNTHMLRIPHIIYTLHCSLAASLTSPSEEYWGKAWWAPPQEGHLPRKDTLLEGDGRVRAASAKHSHSSTQPLLRVPDMWVLFQDHQGREDCEDSGKHPCLHGVWGLGERQK
jgi:hypothetical protein